ncbi:MAG: tetratricopeptide repeat protein, partial [Calditrichaceae bacterium]
VLVIVLIFLYWNHSQNIKAEKSSTLLGKAQLEYQNLNYSKAKEFITELREEYPGTEAAEQGMFLYANLLYQEKKYAEAKDYYKEFIDSYSGSNILIASGLAGYAACLEEEKQYEEAAEYYIKAQDKAEKFVQAPVYLYLAGLDYASAGEYDKAREAFKTIVNDYENSKRYTDAKAELILLAQK